MLQYDLTAGLAVPPQLLVRELGTEDGGGTELVYQLPSRLIAGVNRDPRLVKVAEVLDEKVAEFVKSVVS